MVPGRSGQQDADHTCRYLHSTLLSSACILLQSTRHLAYLQYWLLILLLSLHGARGACVAAEFENATLCRSVWFLGNKAWQLSLVHKMIFAPLPSVDPGHMLVPRARNIGLEFFLPRGCAVTDLDYEKCTGSSEMMARFPFAWPCFWNSAAA